MYFILIIVLPFVALQIWTNRPIQLVKMRKSKLSVHQAYLEYRRRNSVSSKVVIAILSLTLLYTLTQIS